MTKRELHATQIKLEALTNEARIFFDQKFYLLIFLLKVLS